jgi:4-amino-4-deoxy-L-arabinose transferase-like glycosyltransferase
VLGLVRLTPDPAYYLDHPEAFGRFYIVARLCSAMWGMLGIVAVFLLVRRICGSSTAAFCAALCFMLMPVVVTAAHEAKPHLAGTTLMLWAVFAGAKYAESGRRATGVFAAALCGAAVAMVPSALLALVVIPVMELFRPVRSARRLAALLVLAGIVYCATNPYVPLNLIRDRAVLRSNFGNSSDFYHASATGFPRAMLLTGLGMSFVLAVVGGIGAVALAIRAGRTPLTDPAEVRRRTTGMLLAAATLPVGLAFVLFASGQPADYARFALPFDAFLAIEAIVAVETFVRHPRWRAACLTTLVLTTAFMGVEYVAGFARDSGSRTSRTIVAAKLAGMLRDGGSVLASREEPAPWSLPPVDLFRWQIVLPPRSWPQDQPFAGAVVNVAPEDFSEGSLLKRLFFSTPISWADKPFRIQLASGKVVVP